MSTDASTDADHRARQPQPRRTRRMARGALGVALVASLGLAACGDDDGGDVDGPEGQPTPAGSVFVSGEFDELPRYRSGEEIGPVSETDGVITQSYVVDNVLPQDVLDFYDEALVDWTVDGPVEALGDEALRQTWRRDGATLQVSAAMTDVDAEGIDQDNPQVQYSLLYEPA